MNDVDDVIELTVVKSGRQKIWYGLGALLGISGIAFLLLSSSDEGPPPLNENPQSLTPPSDLPAPRIGEEQPNSLEYQRSAAEKDSRIEGSEGGISLPTISTNSPLSKPNGTNDNNRGQEEIDRPAAPIESSDAGSQAGALTTPGLANYRNRSEVSSLGNSGDIWSSVFNSWTPPSSGTTAVRPSLAASANENAVTTDRRQTNAVVQSNEPPAAASILGKPSIPAGEIMLAVSKTGANSDLGGEVVVTLVGSDFGENRLIGAYTRKAGYLDIEFNLMSVSRVRGSLPIRARAINLNTLTPGVRTKYRSRWLKRYGLPFLAAFVGGFGDSVQQGTTTSILGNGQSQQVVERDFDLEDQLIISAGAASTALANTLSQEASALQPLVTLDANQPIGILFLQDVYIDPTTQQGN